MERKIGEIFTYNGKTYQVIPSLGTCKGCALYNGITCLDKPLKSKRGNCSCRKDKKYVIFIELYNMEIKIIN